MSCVGLWSVIVAIHFLVRLTCDLLPLSFMSLDNSTAVENTHFTILKYVHVAVCFTKMIYIWPNGFIYILLNE